MAVTDMRLGRSDIHFNNVGRNLLSLRQDERFCDLAFICHPPKNSNVAKKPKVLFAHTAVLQPQSCLIRSLVEISRSKQLSDRIYISLDDVSDVTVAKLLDFLYLGQISVNQGMDQELRSLRSQLCLDIKLSSEKDLQTGSGHSTPEVVDLDDPTPTKRDRKEDKSNNISSSVDSEKDQSCIVPSLIKSADDQAKAKDSAEKSARHPIVEITDKNDEEKDGDKHIRKSTMKPYLDASSKNTPQKRRLTETDKKLTPKASKKLRQEDGDDSSDTDVEAVEARKKEIAVASIASPKAKSKDAASDSESEATAAAASPKRKPGPKRKQLSGPASKKPTSRRNSTTTVTNEANDKKEEDSASNATTKSTANEEAFRSTDTVQYCVSCGKIFLSYEAHQKHMLEEHGGSIVPGTSDVDSDEGQPKKVDRGRKPGPARRTASAGPASKTLKSEPPLKETSPVGETEKKTEMEPPKKAIGPKSKSRPGPASKSVDNSSHGHSSSKSSSEAKDKRPSSVSGGRSHELFSSSDEKKKEKSSTSSKSGQSFKKTGTFASDFVHDLSSDDDDAKNVKSSGGSSSNKAHSAKSPPTAKKPKIRISLGGCGDESDKEKKSAGRSSLGSAGGQCRKCKICSEIFDKPANLKNHVLNHYKDQLYALLPKSAPYYCPDCQAPSRDKVTLMRHYALTHRVIYQFCSESDLVGLPADGHEAPSPSRKSSKPTKSSSSTFERDPKKKSRETVSSDSSDQDGPDVNGAGSSKRSKKLNGSAASKKVVSVDSDDDDDGDKKKSLKKIISGSATHFSDSDSDSESVSKSANDAIKSFDQLFGDSAAATVDENKNGSGKKKKKASTVISDDSD